MANSNILIYLLRRDLRVSDNPILDHLATTRDHGFTHLLPVYIFPAHQMEISGFIKEGKASCPYPEARSALGKYRRCGPYRAKFIAEAVWDLKQSYESLESGMLMRAGLYQDTLRDLLHGLQENKAKVGAVWLTSEEGVEERRDERTVANLCREQGIDFKAWVDEKYFIDDRDLPLSSLDELPDVFTDYRKKAEPLRSKPRPVVAIPAKSALPPFPEVSCIPPQALPFVIPDSFEKLRDSLVSPVEDCAAIFGSIPEGATNAHPFVGGETQAQARLGHLLSGDGLKNYKTTRNELIGTEFSTKLSAYLALGNVSARQIHHLLLQYEDGTNDAFSSIQDYGQGENEDTAAVRYHLLWRDYMRLSARKFKHHLFRLDGFVGARQSGTPEEGEAKWKTPNKTLASLEQEPGPEAVSIILEKFQLGMTGMGLIDASQRELLCTGYTSNRARQNVASFLAKHLYIDWRYGAEWYEMLLVDYDVSSNWANWQYVAGVGNDPRGNARIFNPVKQSYDYDKNGSYVRSWVPEIRALQHLDNVFQPWTTCDEVLKEAGLHGHPLVTHPVKKINFAIDRKPRNNRRPYIRRHRPNRASGSNFPNMHGNTENYRPGPYNGGSPHPSHRGGTWRMMPNGHMVPCGPGGVGGPPPGGQPDV
ncbi:DASH family cryptochrome [Thozetella sp. PMI_491]|nr:DASH family cryptochrome [Thozetella sp. PMI_491]